MTEDEVVGWHHQRDGHEFEQALGVGDRQGGLACCSPWGRRELDMTERLNNNIPLSITQVQSSHSSDQNIPHSSPSSIESLEISRLLQCPRKIKRGRCSHRHAVVSPSISISPGRKVIFQCSLPLGRSRGSP